MKHRSRYGAVDPSNPEAAGRCDRGGEIRKRRDLRKQMAWFGDRLGWTGLWVCAQHMDEPQPQDRAKRLRADPVPVPVPRPDIDFRPDRVISRVPSVESTLLVGEPAVGSVYALGDAGGVGSTMLLGTPSIWNSSLIVPVEAAALGDSIVANSQTGGPNYAIAMRGAWHWANFLMAAPMRFRSAAIQGVSGETSAQILARVGNITSLSPLPEVCFVSAGNNDVHGGVAPAVTLANIAAIRDALNGAGVLLATGPIWPRDTWSSGQLAAMDAVNAGMAAMASPGRFVYADYSGAIIDGGTGYTLPNVLYDGVHPGNRGARLMADAYVSELSGYFLGSAALAELSDPGNYFTNGVLAGSTAPGGAWTGFIASPGFINYSSGAPTGGTRVASKQARGDGIGEWQQFAVTGTTIGGAWGGGFAQTFAPSSKGMVLGETYELLLEVEVDAGAANFQGLGGQIIYNDGAGSTQHNVTFFQTAGDAHVVPFAALTHMVVRFPPFTMRADNGSDSLLFRMSGAGQGDMAGGITATYRVGRVALRKI